MIKNFEELNAKYNACRAKMDGKFAGEGGKRAIVLCGGTGTPPFPTVISPTGSSPTKPLTWWMRPAP